MNQPTVAAISTPFGKGGIAVIRISGEDAITVAGRMFRPMSGRSLEAYPARTAVYGEILQEGRVIDTGLATVFRAPASFTGENVVEISCHGGILLSRTVLASAFLCGAEPAGPGEFSKRAFLSGKIGLTEAEGIMDLIDAESQAQIRLASGQARGHLRAEIDAVCAELKRLLSSVYAYVDYPDEDMTDVTVEELRDAVDRLLLKTARLRESYHAGKAICQGIKTVLIGKPNTGKSSLLNLLLGEERAIVTDIPGTTRDTVEESASLGQVMLRLCDTAGIRQTEDAVEKLGVARSVDKLKDAELIIGVFDASVPLTEEDHAVIAHLRDALDAGKEVLVLGNQCDKGQVLTQSDFPHEMQVIFASVRMDGAQTLETLRQTVETRYLSGALLDGEETAVVTNARQYAAICGAADALRSAKNALDMGMTQDVAGMDLELALARLRESDGRETSCEIVDEIFARFCVGK